MNKHFPVSTNKKNLLVVAKNNLAIINKLLPNIFNSMDWWNSLSEELKLIFLMHLDVSPKEFQQQPKFYLEKVLQLAELYLNYGKIQDQDISALGNLTQLTNLSL
ncbi:hypothetical protein ACWIUH_08530, partial [Ursidibacter arcticus]